ncbi:MAG: hypothetical protein IPK19_25460 [Chloroflexi bacterium]|nr:hypothetical protein [Chloroflexota bacterium]
MTGMPWRHPRDIRTPGFRLEDIRTRVFIWQGEDDPSVTPAMARTMAEHIPNAELKLVPEAAHFRAYSRWRDILGQITAVTNN